MKKFITLFLVLCLIVSLVGCGSGTGDLQKDIVRMNIYSEPDSLHPYKSAASDTESIIMNIFDGLIAFDENGKLMPSLAESWQVSDDGLQYTFKLRDDVTFHNGDKFTSKDVVFSLKALSGLSGDKPYSDKFATLIVDVIATDEYNVEVRLNKRFANFLSLCTISILPDGYNDHENLPIGTGAYKFVEYVPSQKIVLKKNTNYYNNEKAAEIENVEVYFMSDSSAVVSALRSGQLDVASIMANDAKSLEEDYTIIQSPQNMVQIFAFNLEEEPFNDIRIRQAIAHTVNKQDVIKGAFDNAATELYSNFSPIFATYYNNELEDIYPQDLEKAKALMKEAGYEDGFTMTITVPSNYQQHIDTAQIFASNLEQIGITALVETVEWATWLENVYTNREFESTIIGFTGKLNPNDILARYRSDFPKNFMNFNNQEFDNCMKMAAIESDDELRINLYKKCQEILTTEAPAVFVCDPHLVVATRKELKGFNFYPINFLDFKRMYYDVE